MKSHKRSSWYHCNRFCQLGRSISFLKNISKLSNKIKIRSVQNVQSWKPMLLAHNDEMQTNWTGTVTSMRAIHVISAFEIVISLLSLSILPDGLLQKIQSLWYSHGESSTQTPGFFWGLNGGPSHPRRQFENWNLYLQMNYRILMHEGQSSTNISRMSTTWTSLVFSLVLHTEMLKQANTWDVWLKLQQSYPGTVEWTIMSLKSCFLLWENLTTK